ALRPLGPDPQRGVPLGPAHDHVPGRHRRGAVRAGVVLRVSRTRIWFNAESPPVATGGLWCVTARSPTTRHPMSDAFRWQGFFQQSREPLFVLNRQRRLLFANRAWEALTGQPFAQARGKTCTRRLSDEPLAPLLRALWPPPEVLQGQTVRVPRAVPPAAGGPPWWHVEFFPLMGDEGVLGILGRIRADAVPPPPKAPRVPEAWAALREQTARRFDFDLWASELPA